MGYEYVFSSSMVLVSSISCFFLFLATSQICRRDVHACLSPHCTRQHSTIHHPFWLALYIHPQLFEILSAHGQCLLMDCSILSTHFLAAAAMLVYICVQLNNQLYLCVYACCTDSIILYTYYRHVILVEIFSPLLHIIYHTYWGGHFPFH